MRRLTSVLLAAILLLVGAGSAIAQEHPPSSAMGEGLGLSEISAAVEATLETGTAHISSRTRVSGVPTIPDDTVLLDVSGQISFGVERRGRMRVQMLSYPGSAEIIIDGHDVYIGGDMYEGMLPAGAWLYVDAEDPPPVWGEVADDLLAQSDAAVLLYWLLGADGAIDVIGTEHDEGAEVLHAEVPIDLDIALERTPPDQRVVFAANLAGIRSRGGDVDGAEFWLDGDGMVRRIAYEMNWPMGDASSTWEFDTEFSAFGEPFDLGLPDAEDIIDAWDAYPQGVE